MIGKFALLVHPEAEASRRLGESLAQAGLKVMAAASEDEAIERIGTSGLFLPDVLITTFETASPDHRGLVDRLRSNPLTESIPVVLLASGDPDERRRALRAGFNHLVPPPHDSEELVLTTRLALEQHRDERLLSGSLAQFSVTDLLQTAEAARRSGTVVLRSRGRGATLWLRGGRIVDAETDGGLAGKEAVFDVAGWTEGSFEADFGPVSVPERITESTSYLLLEAMRRLDERQRAQESPPHAAIPDTPPIPPPEQRSVHRSLTLLAVTASYASEHLAEGLVEERLEGLRRELEPIYPVLGRFRVEPGGQTAFPDAIDDSIEAEVVVAAVGAWLRRFFTETERVLPGRFDLRRLRQMTEAVSDDLAELGFYRALGLDDERSAGEDRDDRDEEAR